MDLMSDQTIHWKRSRDLTPRISHRNSALKYFSPAATKLAKNCHSSSRLSSKGSENWKRSNRYCFYQRSPRTPSSYLLNSIKKKLNFDDEGLAKYKTESIQSPGCNAKQDTTNQTENKKQKVKNTSAPDLKELSNIFSTNSVKSLRTSNDLSISRKTLSRSENAFPNSTGTLSASLKKLSISLNKVTCTQNSSLTNKSFKSSRKYISSPELITAFPNMISDSKLNQSIKISSYSSAPVPSIKVSSPSSTTPVTDAVILSAFPNISSPNKLPTSQNTLHPLSRKKIKSPGVSTSLNMSIMSSNILSASPNTTELSSNSSSTSRNSLALTNNSNALSVSPNMLAASCNILSPCASSSSPSAVKMSSATPNMSRLLEVISPIAKHPLLGRGRFGSVIAARYKGKSVAVKVIEVQEDLNMTSAISGERNALGLRHPNIVKVQAIAWPRGSGSSSSCKDLNHRRYCIVMMETCSRGADLQTLIDNDYFHINQMRILRYTTDLCSALAYLHSRSILHLDLKPRNVLVALDGRCKLCDFGSSVRATSAAANFPDQIRGTLPYCCPEILQGYKPTPASDIYSLGVTMWQLVHRERPLNGNSPEEALYGVVRRGLRPTKESTEQTAETINVQHFNDTENITQNKDNLENKSEDSSNFNKNVFVREIAETTNDVNKPYVLKDDLKNYVEIVSKYTHDCAKNTNMEHYKYCSEKCVNSERPNKTPRWHSVLIGITLADCSKKTVPVDHCKVSQIPVYNACAPGRNYGNPYLNDRFRSNLNIRNFPKTGDFYACNKSKSILYYNPRKIPKTTKYYTIDEFKTVVNQKTVLKDTTNYSLNKSRTTVFDSRDVSKSAAYQGKHVSETSVYVIDESKTAKSVDRSVHTTTVNNSTYEPKTSLYHAVDESKTIACKAIVPSTVYQTINETKPEVSYFRDIKKPKTTSSDVPKTTADHSLKALETTNVIVNASHSNNLSMPLNERKPNSNITVEQFLADLKPNATETVSTSTLQAEVISKAKNIVNTDDTSLFEENSSTTPSGNMNEKADNVVGRFECDRVTSLKETVKISFYQDIFYDFPSAYRYLYRACWSPNTNERPTAGQVLESLKRLEKLCLN